MRLALSTVLVVLLAGCRLELVPTMTPEPKPTATPQPTVAQTWQETVEGMAVFSRSGIPDHLQEPNAKRTGEEFDVNEYFSVLTHLSPEAGYVLDYVYYYSLMGGEPFVYARPEEATPYATFSEYEEAVGENPFDAPRYEYLRHIRIDGTAEGFFEFVVLAIHGGQFYLYWHANYNDLRVVCSREAVEAVIAGANRFGNPLTDEQEQEALRLDLQPQVEFESTEVRVRVVTFTMWGGFFEETYTISRDFPHQLLGRERKELVPYECGVMF